MMDRTRTIECEPNVTILVPCFNEEEVLTETASVLVEIRAELVTSGKISQDSRICFVDDGSTDSTWNVIRLLSESNTCVDGIRLSANFGHQNALLCGLLELHGDAIITLDADLQDDPTVIPEMVERLREGFDVVYGVRDSRHLDGIFKRISASLFYRVMNALGVKIVPNHSDFRLMNRQALEALRGFNEVNLFLRAIVPSLGFQSTKVFYARAKRAAGKTKYPLSKMLAFGWDGVSSFSAVPLRLITGTGLIFSTISVGMGLWFFYSATFLPTTAVPGWASTVVPIFIIGGLQLLSIGVVGEYLAKVFFESKRRPRYIVSEMLKHPSSTENQGER